MTPVTFLVVMKIKDLGDSKMGWFRDFGLVDWPMVIRRMVLILVLGAVACAVAVAVGG